MVCADADILHLTIDGVKVRYGNQEPQLTRKRQRGTTKSTKLSGVGRGKNDGRAYDRPADAAAQIRRLDAITTTVDRDHRLPAQQTAPITASPLSISLVSHGYTPAGGDGYVGLRWDKNSCALDGTLEVLYAYYVRAPKELDSMLPTLAEKSGLRQLIVFLQGRLALAKSHEAIETCALKMQLLRIKLQEELCAMGIGAKIGDYGNAFVSLFFPLFDSFSFDSSLLWQAMQCRNGVTIDHHN